VGVDDGKAAYVGVNVEVKVTVARGDSVTVGGGVIVGSTFVSVGAAEIVSSAATATDRFPNALIVSTPTSAAAIINANAHTPTTPTAGQRGVGRSCITIGKST